MGARAAQPSAPPAPALPVSQCARHPSIPAPTHTNTLLPSPYHPFQLEAVNERMQRSSGLDLFLSSALSSVHRPALVLLPWCAPQLVTVLACQLGLSRCAGAAPASRPAVSCSPLCCDVRASFARACLLCLHGSRPLALYRRMPSSAARLHRRYGFFYILLVSSAFAEVLVSRLDASVHSVSRGRRRFMRLPPRLPCARAASLALLGVGKGQQPLTPTNGSPNSPCPHVAEHPTHRANPSPPVSPNPLRRRVRPPAAGRAAGAGAADAGHERASAHHLCVSRGPGCCASAPALHSPCGVCLAGEHISRWASGPRGLGPAAGGCSTLACARPPRLAQATPARRRH